MSTSNSSVVPTQIPVNTGFDSPWFVLTFSLATVVSGAVYLYFQWHLTEQLKDGFYVLIVVCSTLGLLMGLKLLSQLLLRGHRDLVENIAADQQQADALHQAFCHEVFNFRRALVVGLVFGILSFLSFIFVLAVWPKSLILQFLLAFFQFVVAIVMGIGLYLLVLFTYKINVASRSLKVSLFYVYSPQVLFVLDSTQYVAILTGAYVGLSMLSIRFSQVLPKEEVWVDLFVLFSFSMVFVAYFVPLLTIAAKMRASKRALLYNVERKMFKQYQKIDDGSCVSVNDDVEKFDFFMRFRKDLIDINAWPFTLKWLVTTFTLLFSALLPYGVKHVLEPPKDDKPAIEQNANAKTNAKKEPF